MAHAQKPDLVSQRNGRVHLNWRGEGGSVQSTTDSRGVRISSSNGSNAGYTMFWGRVQDYWLPIPLACFPFTSPTVRLRVPSGFNWALTKLITREMSQLLCRQLLPRRTGFNEGMYMCGWWCTKWYTDSSFSRLFSFPLSIIPPIFRLYTQSAPTYQKDKQEKTANLRKANPMPHQISTQKIWKPPKRYNSWLLWPVKPSGYIHS